MRQPIPIPQNTDKVDDKSCWKKGGEKKTGSHNRFQNIQAVCTVVDTTLTLMTVMKVTSD